MAPASLCVPPKGPELARPPLVTRQPLLRGRQASQPRRSFKAVTRARTPPLHTRERNRQKLEMATQEPETNRPPLYERYVQPESFAVPKSFSEACRGPFR